MLQFLDSLPICPYFLLSPWTPSSAPHSPSVDSLFALLNLSSTLPQRQLSASRSSPFLRLLRTAAKAAPPVSPRVSASCPKGSSFLPLQDPPTDFSRSPLSPLVLTLL
ncbi:hypothetical protein ACFX13_025396 [Malus domestica]